ncbi:MAG: reductive dehalogenase [Anaerolineae bacterium]
MQWYDYAGWLMAIAMGLLTLSFLAASYREREHRAFRRGLWLLVPLAVWISLLAWLPLNRATVLFAGEILFVLFLALLLLPLGKKGTLRITGPLERVDERDIIFARMRYEEGTPRYLDYYSRHPERRKLDDGLRAMPRLGGPGTPLYHPFNSRLADAAFGFLADIRATVEGPVSPEVIQVDPTEMSRRLKGMARYYGARLAGVAKLNPAYVYTHIGRGLGQYGTEIELDHPYALVFAVEMDHFMVKQAPGTTTLTESASQYVEAAKIAIVIAYYIRSLGYQARAHMDANYRLIVPPIAADAGLGEIGRIGILMSPQYGPRMRLGVVTTDMPLTVDRPLTYGIQDFCERCLKCAYNCPAGAIPRGKKTGVRGVEKWAVDADKCYTFWRKVGTDCAICMSVCPYSKPAGFIHNATRFAISRSVVARQLAIWADDIFYGKHPRSKELPPWMKPLAD